MPVPPPEPLATRAGIAAVPQAPVGYPAGITPAATTIAGGLNSWAVAPTDHNPDLRFPLSVAVFERMRSEDGGIGSVLRALTLPILAAKWRLAGGPDLDGDGEPDLTDSDGAPRKPVRPEVMAFIRSELGLDVERGQARRRRNGIVWRDHLREALLALPLGFAPFEVTYDVGPANPGHEVLDGDRPGRQYAHLGSLALRHPRTLLEVRVDERGRFRGVVQTPPLGPSNVATSAEGVFLPADHLVMYVCDREGAEWTGRSVLRQAYKHWLIKDQLIKIGAQTVERNGMGVPVVRITGEEHRAEAERAVNAFRAGATAGIVVGTGIESVDLLGVTGSTADPMPQINYHDQAAAESLLAMFLKLGHDAGARSLGETFVDVFMLALNGFVSMIEDVVTEHIIRDLVEINFGADEPYPCLVADELTSEQNPTAEALASLTAAGLLTADLDLEQDVRRRYGLPVKPKPKDEEVEDAEQSPFTDVGLPSLVDGKIITQEEARGMLGLTGPLPEELKPQPVPAGLAPGAVPGEDGADPAAPPAPGAPAPAPAVPGPRPAPAAEAVTKAAEASDDELVDRVEVLVARLAALRAGHPAR